MLTMQCTLDADACRSTFGAHSLYDGMIRAPACCAYCCCPFAIRPSSSVNAALRRVISLAASCIRACCDAVMINGRIPRSTWLCDDCLAA